MRIVQSKSLVELSRSSFEDMLPRFKNVYLDIGTGDGRFVYKNAFLNKENLYIGVDPNQKQLEKYLKKSQKNKLENVLYILGSIESLPQELNQIINTIYINFPWGALLEIVANPTIHTVKSLKQLLKPQGRVEILLGYHENADKLGLSFELNEKYLYEKLIPNFEQQGSRLVNLTNLTKQDLKDCESTWGKRLSFGQNRPWFFVSFSL